MKNYELLGHQWESFMSLPEFLEYLEKDGVEFRNAPRAETRSSQIQQMLEYPAIQHLGFGPIDGVREKSERGVDLSIEYFFGNWWDAEEIQRLSGEVRDSFRLDNPDDMANIIGTRLNIHG